MIKKLFCVFLVFVMCFSLSTVTSARTTSYIAEKNESINDNMKLLDSEEASSDLETATENRLYIDPKYIRTIVVDTEKRGWLYNIPNEVMVGPTSELLEYFLQSNYMFEQVFSCSSVFSEKGEEDFSRNMAFRELIARDDFVESLDAYAKEILNGKKDIGFNKVVFQKVINQPAVQLLVADLADTADYPNLQTMYADVDIQKSNTRSTYEINGILYTPEGTVSTANNHSVIVLYS